MDDELKISTLMSNKANTIIIAIIVNLLIQKGVLDKKDISDRLLRAQSGLSPHIFPEIDPIAFFLKILEQPEDGYPPAGKINPAAILEVIEGGLSKPK
ncbi:MAG: hypothetical protein R3D71_05835 [Rickettsiales bacterium]